MSSKFVRNITGTKIRGSIKEPLYTNVQNDLLNDNEDVFIRNKNEYHALTDNLKTLEYEVGTFLSISNITKNGLRTNGIKATKVEAESGNDVAKIMNPLRVKEAIDQQVPTIVNDILIPVLARISTLETEVATLKSKVETLEGDV